MILECLYIIYNFTVRSAVCVYVLHRIWINWILFSLRSIRLWLILNEIFRLNFEIIRRFAPFIQLFFCFDSKISFAYFFLSLYRLFDSTKNLVQTIQIECGCVCGASYRSIVWNFDISVTMQDGFCRTTKFSEHFYEILGFRTDNYSEKYSTFSEKMCKKPKILKNFNNLSIF